MRLLIALALLLASLYPQVPKLVNYQGKLMKSEGTLVTDGMYTITFALYNVETGGTPIWTEEQNNVSVKDGVFNVLLGASNVLDNNIFSSGSCYLGIKVGSDQEMQPRFLITSVIYSLIAETVPANSIQTTHLQNNAVTTDKMAGGAVTAVKIAAGEVVKDINGLKDNVTLVGGDNINIEKVDNNLTISATTGGQTGIQSLNDLEGKVKIVGSSNVTVDTPTDSTVRIMVVDTSGGGTGDITAVVAGSGLTGGSVFGDAELNVGQETGIFVTDAGVGLDTIFTDERYVQHGELSSVDGDMIEDGEILAADLATGSVTTDKIRSTGASTNDVITYDGNAVIWAEPPADNDWVVNGDNVYKTSGSVGIGISPVYPFHLVPPSIASTGLYLDFDKTNAGYTSGITLNVANTWNSADVTYGISATAQKSTGSGETYGISALGSTPAGTGHTYGVKAVATGNASGNKYGVYGAATGLGNLWAGYFQGNVNVTGQLYTPRISGYITIDSLQYNTPRVKYFSLGCDHFNPTNNTVSFDNHSFGGAYITTGSGMLVAPVHLPHGALLQYITYYYDDTDATYDLTFRFMKKLFMQGDWTYVIAEQFSSGSSGLGSLTYDCSSTEIDNTSGGLMITVAQDQGNWSSSLKINGVLIQYTIDEVP
jgi:hypothetical protein